jgi:diguanylate cyclase (GGDEF)-like protein
MALLWGPDFTDPAKRLDALEYAVESLPLAVSLVQRDGVPVFGNAVFRKLLHIDDAFQPRLELTRLMAEGVFDDWKQSPVVYRDKLVAAMAAGRTHTSEIEIGNKIFAFTDKPLAPNYILSSTKDVTERRRVQRRAEHLAYHDALTGLPNRAAFTAELDRAFARAKKAGKFTILSIDIDHFKDINDVFGHCAGDGVLRRLAEILLEVAGPHFVARLGGDEFMMIIRGPAPLESAAALADNLLAAVSTEMDIAGHTIRIGLSIGAAVYPADGKTSGGLLNHADAALYRAKADGRGVLRFYQPAMDERVHEQRLLQQDLRLALNRNELSLVYQPQATVDGVVTGFEALVRWDLPRLGVVMPTDFIPLAEKSGLILDIGAWILSAACREAASWRTPLQISVNISPVQFRHGDLADQIAAILADTGLAPDRLEIEITEGVLVDDFQRALSLLRRIKALGVKVAMDDFGTGYSSLSYLQAFPFDKLKVDQSFIAKLDSNEHAREIIRAVIGLGRGLKLPVVAEGVETQEQVAFLSAEQCYGIQGFLVGEPHPMSRYAEIVGAGSVPAEVSDTAAGGRHSPASHHVSPRTGAKHRSASGGTRP